MTPRLKIHADRDIVRAGKPWVTMLYPFWGKNPEDPRDPSSGRFDRYTDSGQALFEPTSLDESAVAVLPIPWEVLSSDPAAATLADEFIRTARKSGRRTIIFFNSDSDEPIAIPDAIIFRTSLRASRRAANEYALPAWSEDPLGKYLPESLTLRVKPTKPVVGFCGFIPPRITVAFRRILRPEKGDGRIRGTAIRLLTGHPQIDTRFVVRSSFYRGLFSSGATTDYKRQEYVRSEFFRNINESDYVLCARGDGNFSYRLYETLSCGRIPLFIDTDCVLPFADEIDWRRLCVWVDETEISRIADKLLAFHAAITPDAYLELQRSCRRLWEEWLSPPGFFTQMGRQLIAMKNPV